MSGRFATILRDAWKTFSVRERSAVLRVKSTEPPKLPASGKMTVTLAEMIDRWIILRLKLLSLSDDELSSKYAAVSELANNCSCSLLKAFDMQTWLDYKENGSNVNFLLRTHAKLAEPINKLDKIHLELWVLETKIRKYTYDPDQFTMQQSLEYIRTSMRIRELNDLRSAVKNDINGLAGAAVEPKIYKQ